jgi:hypothetical protein
MRPLLQTLRIGLGIWIVGALGIPHAEAQCSFPHGDSTGLNGWSSMVQAFAPCGAPDWDGFPGLPQNTSTLGGIPACSPPQTYHQVSGSPTNGWVLDTATGRARLRLDQQSTPTDVRIRLDVDNVRDGTGAFAPIGSRGALSLILRMTLNDSAGGDMTTIDIPIATQLVISSATGDGNIDTTLNARLAILAQPPLPTCTSVEVIDAFVFDPVDDKFLRIGHFRN